VPKPARTRLRKIAAFRIAASSTAAPPAAHELRGGKPASSERSRPVETYESMTSYATNLAYAPFFYDAK
jgi:hypothetical protein